MNVYKDGFTIGVNGVSLANISWRERHKDKVKELKHREYEKHKDRYKKYRHNYYLTHKDQLLQKRREYYQKNKERIRAYVKDWVRNHRKHINERVHMVKQKLLLDILREHNFKCDKCGFNDIRALQIHHHFGDPYGFNRTNRQWWNRLREAYEKKVPIAVLCANCHFILHHPNRFAPFKNYLNVPKIEVS